MLAARLFQARAAPSAAASGSQQSYYRWRLEYGGLKLDQAKRLTLDKLILKEALEGKY